MYVSIYKYMCMRINKACYFEIIQKNFICIPIILVSCGTLENTIIFPLSGVAFMMVYLQQFSKEKEDNNTFEM